METTAIPTKNLTILNYVLNEAEEGGLMSRLPPGPPWDVPAQVDFGNTTITLEAAYPEVRIAVSCVFEEILEDPMITIAVRLLKGRLLAVKTCPLSVFRDYIEHLDDVFCRPVRDIPTEEDADELIVDSPADEE